MGHENAFLAVASIASFTAIPTSSSADGPSSRMFSGAGQTLLDIFATQNVTANFHKYCVSPETYSSSLAGDYRLISTNRDWDGQTFVSAFEHRT